jgi:hypothetical protein|tara:strand:- start:687 stop:962 length:276 start_codon:yes stop_codon:yes gene_type:complete
MPYNDITKTKRIPKNIFVLNIAKISNALESLIEKICVKMIVIAMKIANSSKEKIFVVKVIKKNQNENPAVTASALKRGEDTSISNRIDKCH